MTDRKYSNVSSDDENNEQFASDCVTSYATQCQNSSEQYHNFTNTLPSVEQILPQRTSFNFTSLQRSEDNYGSWIQSNELTGVNDTQHRFNDSSFSNNAANYFYCTVCYFCSADWCQVQNHLNTVHGENSYLTICQGQTKKTNSYIDGNVHLERANSGGFMESIPQLNKKTTKACPNIVARITRTWESKKSTRSSTMSTNTTNATLIPSKHVDPERKVKENRSSLFTSKQLRKPLLVDRGINESTPTNSKKSLFRNPSRAFDAADGPGDKILHHSVNEGNEHTLPQFTSAPSFPLLTLSPYLLKFLHNTFLFPLTTSTVFSSYSSSSSSSSTSNFFSSL
nr:hypothetical transcript [Hymenolepis microstoma]